MREVFDHGAMLERLGGDRRLVREVLETFLEEGPGMLERVLGALASRDAERLERSAHALRGALMSVAAPAAADLAGQLESAAGTGDLETCPAHAAALEGGLAQLTGEIDAWLRGET